MTLAQYIQWLIENDLKSYFKAVDCDGEIITIRVADHRMNERNNSSRTLSFISSKKGKTDSSCYSDYEWLVEGDTCNGDTSIEDVLKDFCFTHYFDNGNKKLAY